ncbi:MAG: hypothetical protein V9G24_06940 [Rhodoblastus sp.]
MTNGSQKRKQRAAQKHEAAAPKAATTPVRTGVQTLQVEADEAGMRLDRWFKRRFPGLALSHLAKIARKGEVRVDGRRVDTATRLEEGQSVRVPPLTIEAPAAPAAKRANPEDAEAIRRMVLFEDKHVLVLNKPYGLAVQGGSGTKRHIDGMLAALADEKGNQARARASPRPRYVGRAAGRQEPQDGGRARRNFSLAQGAEDLLGAGGRRSEAVAGAHFALSGEGAGDGRPARRAFQRAPWRGSEAVAGRSGKDARGQTRRRRCAAFAHLLRHRRQDRAEMRVAVDEAADGTHASVARACGSHRPSDLRRSEIRTRKTTAGATPCMSCPRRSSASCICWRAASCCRIRPAA